MTSLPESRSAKALRYAGLGLVVSIGLLTEALVLYFTLRTFDHDGLLTLVILLTLGLTLSWPLASWLSGRRVVAYYREWYAQTVAGAITPPPAPGPNPAPLDNRAPGSLDISNDEAHKLLQVAFNASGEKRS